MIRKWRNRFIVFLLISAFLTIVGYYLYINVDNGNKIIAELKTDGIEAEVEMRRLPNTDYSGGGAYLWGYDLPPEANIESDKTDDKFDGATLTAYTLLQYDEMGHKVKIKYIVKGDDYYTFDLAYIERYKPSEPVQGIFMWVLAGICFAAALYFVVRNIIVMCVVLKGEESIGQFEEASHTRFGSNRYYRIKFTFMKDGQVTTAYTPAIYDYREADKLKAYGTFPVRYKGKFVAIDQKL